MTPEEIEALKKAKEQEALARAAAEQKAAEMQAKFDAIEAERKSREEAAAAEELRRQPIEAQLQHRIQQMEAANAQLVAETQRRLQAAETQTNEYFLRGHREQALRHAGNDLILEMVVTGPTPQAIDASIQAAKETYARLQSNIQARVEQEHLSRINPTAVPAPAPNPAWAAPPGYALPAAANAPSPYTSQDVQSHMQAQPPVPQFQMSPEEMVRSKQYTNQNKGQYFQAMGAQPNGGMQMAPASYQHMAQPQPRPGQMLQQPFGVQAPAPSLPPQTLQPNYQAPQFQPQQAPQYYPVPPPMHIPAPQVPQYAPQEAYPPQYTQMPAQGAAQPVYGQPQGYPQNPAAQFLPQHPRPDQLQAQNPQQFSPQQPIYNAQPQQQGDPPQALAEAQAAIARARGGVTSPEVNAQLASQGWNLQQAAQANQQALAGNNGAMNPNVQAAMQNPQAAMQARFAPS